MASGQDNKSLGLKIVQCILAAMMTSAFLFFVWGQTTLAPENNLGDGTFRLFQSDWIREMPDGSQSRIEVPGQCDAERGEWVTIRTTLSQETQEVWLCIRSMQQDMRIFVGDELRKEYSTLNTQLFGKTSTMTYVFFPIYENDAGKELRIEFMSNSSYSGYVSEIFSGEMYDIAKYFVKLYAPSAIVAILMLLVGLFVIFGSIFVRLIYKREVEILHLGNGILIASTWLLVESRLRQFIFPNSTVAMLMGFLLIAVLPYPMMSYVNSIQKHRYRKVYTALGVATAVNCLVVVLLQILDIKDFFETMMSSHIIIIVMIAVMAITIVTDIVKGYIYDYREVAIGFAILMLAGICEIILTYTANARLNGIALCVGLVVLLITAGLKSIRDMFNIEKEKQLAVAASESRAQFLANMSHEIRTPINTVIGMNEMILRENKDETIHEYAENIQNAGHLLVGLINDILDFSKIEAGKLDIIPTDYHVSEMLSGVIRGLRFKAECKELEIKLDIEEHLPSVLCGDEIRIRQILNNFLTNAVKYTAQGTITLSVRGEYSSNGFELVMSVADTGIGIRKEDIPHLFDSFRRLDEKKNRHIEGTGLGLNITRQLAELMGGSIEVQSEYGKGSCFTVRIPQQVVDGLPIGNTEEAYRREVTEEEKLPMSLYIPNARILAVDDTKMNLSVVKALLRRTGAQIDTASGGNECLELCRKYKYDIILMDHMMPDPDGIETLHLLRADKSSLNQKTKVIVLTANAISGVREKYIAEGFADYMAKPLGGEELEKMLKNHLPKDMSGKSGEQKENPLLEINKESAMRYSAGDEELYNEVLQEYCKQEKEYSAKLQKYFDEQNWKEFQIIAHAIKGASLLVGANNFSEKAKEMEFAVKEENIAKVQAEGQEFIRIYRELVRMLEGA